MVQRGNPHVILDNLYAIKKPNPCHVMPNGRPRKMIGQWNMMAGFQAFAAFETRPHSMT
jgi:hypothetical protein